MYVITKTIGFSAGHALSHLPSTHQCHYPHGHNYTVEVVVQSAELAPEGWVIDYGVLSSAVKKLDHTMLNDVIPGPTTAENIAKVLWEQLQWACSEARPGSGIAVLSVTVNETPTSSATYMPES